MSEERMLAERAAVALGEKAPVPDVALQAGGLRGTDLIPRLESISKSSGLTLR